MTSPENNPIGYLQELCQKKCLGFPKYEEVGYSGPDHCRQFTVKCTFQDFEVLGKASHKKSAKFNAANNMILILKEKQFLDQYSSGSELSNGEGGKARSTQSVTTSPKNKNVISILNEYIQKKFLGPPQFVIASTVGANFVCKCELSGKTTYGHGSTKKAAKTEAVFKMCIELKIIENTAMNGNFQGENQAISDEVENERLVSANSLLPRALAPTTSKQDENHRESTVQNRHLSDYTFNVSDEEEEEIEQKPFDEEQVSASPLLPRVITPTNSKDYEKHIEHTVTKLQTDGKVVEVTDKGRDFEEIGNKSLDDKLISNLQSLSVQPANELKAIPDSTSLETAQGEQRTLKSKTSEILKKWVENDKNVS